MDTRWKKYSYSLTAKVIAFLLAVVSFTGALMIFVNLVAIKHIDLDNALAESYYLSNDYLNDSSEIVNGLKTAVKKYKSEANILQGETVSPEVLKEKENRLFQDFEYNSKRYNPNLNTAENYEIFKQDYADEIAEIRPKLIEQDLNDYRAVLRKLYRQGLIFYARSGETVLTNSINPEKEFFQSFSSYILFDSSEQSIFPAEVKNNNRYYWISSLTDQLDPQDAIYVGFGDEFLDPRISEWSENRNLTIHSLYLIGGFSLLLMITLVFLFLVTGKKFEGEKLELNGIDRIYTDINLVLCFLLILLWFGMMEGSNFRFLALTIPITLVIASLGLTLILSLVRHFKNHTVIKHSLTYTILHKIFAFVREVYNSGNLAIKVVLIVVAYPLVAALTFFMFPITIGAAVWFAMKKVKEFNALKEGVSKVKEGDLQYKIDADGEGELAKLAADINSITDGLNKAVENEIKSERLKSELISNVSHDIRTPLTSIITYVDLLKKEKDETKAEEYREIIDQKAHRLKILTDDLFEAAKASSGNMPVHLEKIDIVSLLTQGLGELDDKIQERGLDFKINYFQDKVYVMADGKLLWRAIENLLVNIFKYALEGSRVYVDLTDSGSRVTLTIKNVSAYELNISAGELMERFKRGDESRTSQGSGLGLSIAKSLVEIQRGSFTIEIDGDLFKAIIQINKE